jgi:thiol-disulfide isomerase/thioredoxin
MFKRLFFILILFSLFLLPNIIYAQTENDVDLHLFFSPTCGHCAQEKIFLSELGDDYAKVNIFRYDIGDPDTSDKLLGFYNQFNISQSSLGLVPVTFITNNNQPAQYYIGFNDNIGEAIKNKLDLYLAGFIEKIDEPIGQEAGRGFKVPFIGEITPESFSPLILSIIVGILDGFNACAMVALGMLLTILISTGVRKKVFIIGITFILVSGAIYFLFISAWLNLFMFLGYYKWITMVVAVLAILFSLTLLKEYISGVVCKICDVPLNGNESWFTKIQRRLFSKLANLLTKNASTIAIVISVAVIAVGINMVELFCSIGFPMAYTKILTSYGLSTWQYYGNLLVYILFYMIDDLLIFAIAISTLKVTRVSDKYLKATKLISAVVLLFLGLVLLFKPELLAMI